MSVTIFVWLPTIENLGHASMLVSDTYISWWPEGKSKKTLFKKVSSEAYTPESYDEDKDAEGKHADDMITIKEDVLNVSAIKEWWSQFSNKKKYHLLGNNCCHVVFKALEEGGAKQHANFSWKNLKIPKGVSEYAKRLEAATRNYTGSHGYQ